MWKARDALGRERLVAHAVPRHRRADVVDEFTVPVENTTGHRADLVGFLEARDSGGDPLRVWLGVVVEQGDVLAGGCRDALVAAARETVVRGGHEEVHVGRSRGDARSAVIPRAVFHDDDLESVGWPVELTQPLDGLERVIRSPEVHEYDGDDAGSKGGHCCPLDAQARAAEAV